jgi:hypothetical protein
LGTKQIYDSNSKLEAYRNDVRVGFEVLSVVAVIQNYVNSTGYRSWLVDELIPNILLGSGIVIHAASHHTLHENKPHRI